LRELNQNEVFKGFWHNDCYAISCFNKKFRGNMKTVKLILLFFVLILKLPAFSQDNTVVLQRTPEQEAVKQTEKLQKELNLNAEQAKQIYEINLRYARERLISSKRSEGLERAKNKNAEIRQVLSADQNDRLQSKRYERTSTDRQAIYNSQQVNPSGFRSTTNFRTNQAELNSRNANRAVNPNFQNGNPTNRPVRTTLPSSTFRATQNQDNQNATRMSTGNPSSSSVRRSDNPARQTVAPNRSQSMPTNEPRREATTRMQNTPTQTASPSRQTENQPATNRR
jgi:hypothetical protein